MIIMMVLMEITSKNGAPMNIFACTVIDLGKKYIGSFIPKGARAYVIFKYLKPKSKLTQKYQKQAVISKVCFFFFFFFFLAD
jgi:hypothetical protein